MPWRREDWEGWTNDESREMLRGSSFDEALRSILRRVPGRSSKSVAVLGTRTEGVRTFLAANFGRVIAVEPDRVPGAATRRRADQIDVESLRRDPRDLRPLHGRLDVIVVVDPCETSRVGDLNPVLAELRRCLVEGGLLLVTVRALSRRSAPYAMPLRDAARRARRPVWHEVEMQYLLRRAGFQGLRVRRVAGTACERLVCMAVRRAFN